MPVGYLPQPGYTWFDRVAAVLPRFVPGYQGNELWSRPYEAHISQSNVDELWQFIKSECPEPATQGRDAGVIGGLVGLPALLADRFRFGSSGDLESLFGTSKA